MSLGVTESGLSTVGVGYEALEASDPSVLSGVASFSPHPAYDEYLRMHKVLVGRATAAQLVQISQELGREELPRYLSVAGWAAAEAALIDDGRATESRLHLLDHSESSWQRALETQTRLNNEDRDHLVERALPYRAAMDIASLPLLRGMVVGDVTNQTCQRVFADSLRIAQANMIQLDLAARAGDGDGIAEHYGFAYECNAILSLNRALSNRWFAIPAIARADSGHHHNRQTHDISVVRQKWGELQSVVPVEIKSHASLKDRQRYEALLVRGKMHLTIENLHSPRFTLEAIAAVYEGDATPRQRTIADSVTKQFMSMLRDYYAGERNDSVASSRSVTSFHDKSLVVEKYPGLSPVATVA